MSPLDAIGDPNQEVAQLVPDVETLARRLAGVDYLVDEGLATSIFLSLRLPQPLLLEGEAGVGKTEAARSLAMILDTPMIRLQCYEGIDAAEALYEWNYPRQLLAIRLADSSGEKLSEQDLFGPDYLIRRPLLAALEHPGPRPAVLLIDEIDRADDDFEAFLLELLGEAAVTIPEIGTIRATHPPIIVLTSNRTRDLHDAVKRRCLYHWIDYPSAEREVEIIRRRVKGASETLAVQVAGAVARMRDSDVQKPPGIAEAIDWLAALDLLGVEVLDASGDRAHVGVGAQVLRRSGSGPRGRVDAVGYERPMSAFDLETVQLDLPSIAGAFARRLHAAGLPVTAERSAQFAAALALVRPLARRRLYWTARAVFVCDNSQLNAFNAVFAAVFGGTGERATQVAPDADTVAVAPDGRELPERRQDATGPPRPSGIQASSGPNYSSRAEEQREARDVEVPSVASDEELLQHKHFDALEPGELADLYRMMARLALATPTRRTRRARRDQRGKRIDLRRTLRGSLRTGGDPIRLAHRRRRVVRRRIVMLCDISGSMEPYARAYLQFLTCAARSGPDAEAFVFATRLTRLTRALSSRNPDRAIQRAAAAAPDWASGTRIGDALKTFNDLHGRRGMARGAVIVILSDGWERGDPMLVGREMQRLARLAYRVVWVNPRAGAPGFAPRAGGMAAALPHCDALVSGHSLRALEEVLDAIASERADDGAPGATWRPPAPITEPEEEPWGSATPVQGSSIAMPSGYSPSRGKTTPGWGTR